MQFSDESKNANNSKMYLQMRFLFTPMSKKISKKKSNNNNIHIATCNVLQKNIESHGNYIFTHIDVRKISHGARARAHARTHARAHGRERTHACAQTNARTRAHTQAHATTTPTSISRTKFMIFMLYAITRA